MQKQLKKASPLCLLFTAIKNKNYIKISSTLSFTIKIMYNTINELSDCKGQMSIF